MKRLLLSILVAFTATLISSGTALAETRFSAAYNVTYQVQTSGTTIVTQAISLRNLTANYYATEYSLSIGATKIKNVSAVDSNGTTLQVNLSTDTDTTKITVTFVEKVVGLNRVLSFTLRYESDDIAVKNGFVWEVIIPRLASPESIDTYNLTLKTPKEIGSVASISPEPAATGSDANFNTFSYNKDQLSKSGVNASFGDHQVFNFNLKYHLSNNRFFPVVELVALPPDTENQTIIYTRLDPRPTEITVDTDGNYMAKYRLDGGGKVDITLEGQVKIWIKPTNPPRSKWSSDQLKKYTVADKYWETNFPSIVEKAKELHTAKAIYDYVTTNLKYDYDRAAGKLERLGASVAIAQPSHCVCMEFTDTFIALARSAGIPARELDGFAYTTNTKLHPRIFAGATAETKTDILHAWPEYWNEEKSAWIQIDPTWGSTTGGVDYFNKLDMNHFVFVIKGLSSIEPYPAGSYKTDPKNQTQDVDVSIAPTETEISVKPKFSWDIGQTIVAGLPFSGQVTIENDGNSSIFGSRLALKSSVIQFSDTFLGPIPPISKSILSTPGRVTDINKSSTDEAKISLTGTSAKGETVNLEETKLLSVKPLWQAVLPWVGALVVVFLGSLVWRSRQRIKTSLFGKFGNPLSD